jgi:hypothetical protein
MNGKVRRTTEYLGQAQTGWRDFDDGQVGRFCVGQAFCHLRGKGQFEIDRNNNYHTRDTRRS